MARYVVKGRITSSDPTNTSFRSIDDPNTLSIFKEYLDSGKMSILQDIINDNDRILWLSYESKDILDEVKAKLGSYDSYLRSDVTWEVLSEG